MMQNVLMSELAVRLSLVLIWVFLVPREDGLFWFQPLLLRAWGFLIKFQQEAAVL